MYNLQFKQPLILKEFPRVEEMGTQSPSSVPGIAHHLLKES